MKLLLFKFDTLLQNCMSTNSFNVQCSHIIGLIKSLQGFKLHNFLNVPKQQSCTSILQQWHAPRGSKIYPVPINQLVVARPTEFRKRKPVTCQTDLKEEYVIIKPQYKIFSQIYMLVYI